MSAPVLQPGDSVHLGWPYIRSEGPGQPTVHRNIAELTEDYARKGVKILTTSVMDTINEPIIIAIFREPK